METVYLEEKKYVMHGPVKNIYYFWVWGGGGVSYDVSHSLGKKIIETLTSFYGLY